MAIEYIEGLARRGVDVYTNVNELSECVELDDDFRIILLESKLYIQIRNH